MNFFHLPRPQTGLSYVVAARMVVAPNRKPVAIVRSLLETLRRSQAARPLAKTTSSDLS